MSESWENRHGVKKKVRGDNIGRLPCFSFVFLFSLARCLAQEIQGRVVTPEGKPVGKVVLHYAKAV